jgi:DNA-directed RNA polymerase subunit beta'
VLTCDTKIGVCGRATAATLRAARRSTSARRWASSPPSRSASRARSSRCVPSTSAAPRSVAPSSRTVEASHDGTVQVRKPQRRHQQLGRPGRDGPQHRDRADRRRPGASAPHRVPYGARLLVDRRGGRRRARSSPSGIRTPCRSSPRRRARRSTSTCRRRLDARGDRRGDGHLQQGRGRLEGSRAAPICVRASRSCDDDGNPIMLANGQEARYFLSLDSVLSIENGQDVNAGDVWRVSRANRRRPATSPAVCRAWRSCSRRASPRISRSSATSTAASSSARTTRAKRRILVVPEGEGAEPVEYLIPKGKHIASRKATSWSGATF